MEPNQATNSPEISWIPQGIPTWVFVANNQVPPVIQTPTVQTSTVQTPAPQQTTEWPLDRTFKYLARFFAKITGQPDPITWAPNPAAQAIQKWENIVGKVRGAANQVVAKATDVTTQAVNTVTNVATQAAQQVQQIIPPPVAPQATPAANIPTAPVTQTAPVVQQPVPEQQK